MWMARRKSMDLGNGKMAIGEFVVVTEEGG